MATPEQQAPDLQTNTAANQPAAAPQGAGTSIPQHHNNNTQPANNTPQPHPNPNGRGADSEISESVVEPSGPARPREEPLKVTVKRRLEAEGRWADVEPVRDQMMRDCRARGLDKAAAQAWTYPELDRLYPPIAKPADPPPQQARIQGLGDIPPDWPTLPANASLQAELGWVQSNRLSVVEDLPSGATEVHLDRALLPAPSRAALGWLETSIRSYAKYIDVLGRSLKDEADEVEHVRRERMAIEEIRSLLADMEV